MNDIFDVLAESMRRDILVHLRNAAPSDLSVGDLVTLVGSTQPTVSKHLKVLRDAGLVAVREDGQHRFYRVNPEPLAIVEGWVSVMNDSSRPSRSSSTPTVAFLPEVDFAETGRSIGRVLGDIVARFGGGATSVRPTKSR